MKEVFGKAAELNQFAAELFVAAAAEAIRERGTFSVALAGGSTPRTLYRLLASAEFRERVDWNHVKFFFGDERSVPPDHPDSNFRMVKESLFDPLSIPQAAIFRWRSETSNPVEVAADYSASLAAELPVRDGFPCFDLVLLGMGADGHTASLFPGTEALTETSKTAVSNKVPQLSTIRYTLTFPVINNARNVVFLVAGSDKATTLNRVLEGDFRPDELPSQGVQPKDGALFWLLDENVAKLLTSDGN